MPSVSVGLNALPSTRSLHACRGSQSAHQVRPSAFVSSTDYVVRSTALGRALFAVILGFSVMAQACALVAGMTFRRDALARALRSQAVTAGSSEVTLRDVVARHPERASYVFTMPPHRWDPASTQEAGSVVAQSTSRGRTRATAEATSNQLNL